MPANSGSLPNFLSGHIDQGMLLPYFLKFARKVLAQDDYLSESAADKI